MATDATGPPTSLGIPTYDVNADAPSGLGFNAAMASINTLINGRMVAPSSPVDGDVPVWNGSAWVRSSVRKIPNSMLEGPLMEGIEDKYASGGAVNNFDFTSISGNFKHLRLVFKVLGTSTNEWDVLDFRANGITTGNYYGEHIFGTGPTPTIGGGEVISQAQFAGVYMPGVQTGTWCVGEYLFVDYADTVSGLTKAFTYHYFAASNNTTGKFRTGFGGGFITGVTGVISSITLFPNINQFRQYSRATLYGIM